jgi:hypothetical protein
MQPQKKDPYPLHFTDEVLNTLIRYEAYYFLDGYLGYYQNFIALEDKYKTRLRGFYMKVMLFRIKIGPPTYQKVIIKKIKDYLDNFMKIFLDDFTLYNDMESHLQKLGLCFQKCKKYGINLNPNKCAFTVFLGMILGFIVSKEGKLPYLKKIHAIENMPPTKNPQQIQVFNGMALFYRCFIKKIVAIMAPIIKLTKKTKTFLWTKECYIKGLGID